MGKLNIPVKQVGDKLEHEEFNLVVDSIEKYSTLGGLDTVDASVDEEATEDVALVKFKGTNTWVEKNLSELGGSGTSVQMRLNFVSEGVQIVSQGSRVVLKYNFSSMLDGVSTGDGTVIYTVNGKRVSAGTIQQGENSFDATAYMLLGNNTIVVEATDSYGTNRKLTFSVETVNISISSTFDDSQIFSGAISYKYTPVGNVEKVVHFRIDGEEVDTYTTSVTNRQQTQVLPTQPHGAHRLEVYMTAELSGNVVESNHLYYTIVCIETGNSTPVVAISYYETEAEQYSTVIVPYVVYDPASSTAKVTLAVNGTAVSTLQVGRTRQSWNYRVNNQGELLMSVTCGSTTATHILQVNKSAIDVEAETADLELYLTSMGRSNAETNRNEWKFGTVSAAMNSFNWATNGWVADGNGNVALHVQGDARVEIPLKVFAQDIRQNGKTIEFEFSTSNVVDYDTPIISCWNNGKGFRITAQEALFVSTQTQVDARFKEEERIRVSFVVSELAENRLIHTYINGVASGSIQYPTTDSFAQVTPADISIGSNDATVDVYNIRVYNNNLNRYQLLDNYIADMDDVDKKLALYERNQIYDAYGNIDLDKLNKQLAVMYIIGDLPQYKKDKKTVKVVYTDLQNPEKSFTATGVQIDVQGTSSQYYPRKNYKLVFKSGFTMTMDGKHASTYQLNDEVLPATNFCMKADFAESSGTHNTGLANYIDWLLKQMNLLTIPQKADSKIRTTVCGFPMIIAHRATEDAPAEFIGKYNFNTDKSAEDTFGFSNGDESVEFSNNTSDRTNLRVSEYDKITDGKADWTNDFEFRYPDDDDANDAYENGTKKPENLKAITDWIVSCIGDADKFKAEIGTHMDKDQLIFYWVITLVFGMVDQRAKNMFLTYYHGGLWLFIFYDNDTCFGVNNEGAIEFLYNVEIHDVIGSQNVWNGAENALWNLVEAAYPEEIKAMYTSMRQQGMLTYDKVMEYVNTRQSDKWPEAIYNEDGYFKYEMPLVEGYLDYSTSHENPTLVKTGAFLYAMQGSREMHRKWWLYYRLLYLDSKWLAGSILSDTAVFRTYTPAQWTGVEPCADLHLTAFNAMYMNVKWGSVSKSARAGEKETVTLPAPEGMKFNDTETIIYGASLISSLGDLSPLYVGTVDVSKMKRLRELIIGSDVPGYSNTNLRSLSVGNNQMLRLIDIRNCPGYTQTLDVSQCDNIEEVLAKGSGIVGVSLPAGGNLKVLKLPAGIRSLTIRNQPSLTNEGFSMEGVANLTTLVLENTNIDTFALLARCFQESVYAIERVRLIDVRGTTDSTELLAKLVRMGGVDENGNDISKAVVTGECSVVGVYEDDLTDLNEMFPELTINYKAVWIRLIDPVMKGIILQAWDANNDGGITKEEAEVERRFPNSTFSGREDIVSLDDLAHISYYHVSGFRDMPNLKTASIGINGYTDAGKGTTYQMFMNCTALERVVNGPNIEYMERMTFFGCKSLKTFVWSNKEKHIDMSAFNGTGFEVLELPDSVELLGGDYGGNTFANCSKLRKMTLGTNIKEIRQRAFADCPVMEEFRIKAKTPPILGNKVFENTPCYIYVPKGYGEIYKAASGWAALATRIEEMEE